MLSSQPFAFVKTRFVRSRVRVSPAMILRRYASNCDRPRATMPPRRTAPRLAPRFDLRVLVIITAWVLISVFDQQVRASQHLFTVAKSLPRPDHGAASDARPRTDLGTLAKLRRTWLTVSAKRSVAGSGAVRRFPFFGNRQLRPSPGGKVQDHRIRYSQCREHNRGVERVARERSALPRSRDQGSYRARKLPARARVWRGR
jgi:hypothetical protein